jgi:ribonuclease BN (tRNA processing enzyme)
MEVLFPGSSCVQRKFSLEIAEFNDRVPMEAGNAKVTPFFNYHPQVDSSFALRIECDGKTIGYSSDSEWTDSLLETARDADLFIAEAYFYEKKAKGHLDFLTLMSHFKKTGAKRLVLTHMSRDMLSRLDGLECEYAEDGKAIEF